MQQPLTRFIEEYAYVANENESEKALSNHNRNQENSLVTTQKGYIIPVVYRPVSTPGHSFDTRSQMAIAAIKEI
jgi:hypothetical protein